MANSLPWSVKGVDPRTRDAAKAAARRAGMTLGEWLDTKIRDEAAEDLAAAPAPEQLDIAALSQRLAKLSGSPMDTASAPAPEPLRADPRQIESLLRQAERTEKLTRGQGQRTADALDSITRWIERTETRLASGERAVAERQERATSLIAEAIKTMGERIADVERRSAEPRLEAAMRAQAAPRLAFSREGLKAAVTDIRTRQQVLDGATESAARPSSNAQERIAALRSDLRELGARLGTESARPASLPVQPAPQPPANDGLLKAIESRINALGERLERLDRRDHFEPVLKPLARIEAEVARLSQDRGGEAYQRFELEIAHLAAKIDALAQRGDSAALAPLLRDMAELREIATAGAQDGRLEELSGQIGTLHFEVARLREGQPDPRELRNLSSAIDDMRSVVLAGQSRDVLSAPLADLGMRLDGFARKLDTIAKHRPDEYIDGRIDALQARLDRMAEEGPAAIARQIDKLAERIDGLAASNRLTRMVGEDAGAVDLGPIEAMLQKLADKIDEAGSPGAGSESFEALEQQISGLAARLDEAAATRQSESGIERTLQDLVVHLRSMREESAAERAALVQASTKAPDRGIAELSTLVTGLRDTQVSTERQTQDTLGAVHHTLEAIMGRLASLEDELVAERRAAREPAPSPAPIMAPPAPEPAAKPAMAAQMRVQAGLVATAEDRAPIAVPPAAQGRIEPSLDLQDNAFDLPLEPGSGRPRPESPVAAAQDAQSIRQSLIAAARRSAKAASEAAATPAAAPEQAAKTPGKLGEIMAKRKRPLLLALAAVILAMGTAHVVTGALRGDAAKTAHNGTPAATTDAETGEKAIPAPAPAAPRKDQSSLAPTAPETQAAASLPADPALAAPPATIATAEPIPAQLQPPASAPAADAVQPVTGLGELPAGLGSPGLRKAAQEGDARAVYELASRAADGPAGQRDPKAALRLFERAAVAGLAPAQFRIGNMFEKGIGTQRDLSLARIWYERAAERGNAKAMHNLAVLYAEGAAGKPDYATANQWFAKAAELGVRDSQYNLAVLLGRGLGAPLDLGQSYLWFSLAASQGDEDAAKKRDEVSQRLKPEELAAAKARTASWRPRTIDAAANEVAPPARGWDATPTAATAKPAKPARS